jgi:hypothetical protein
MSKKFSMIKRTLVLLAIGGSTFGMFGTSFGAGGPFGCNWADYGNYETLYTATGQQVIQQLSDAYLNFGTDWDAIVRTPATNFAQNIWGNWVGARVPNDLELH